MTRSSSDVSARIDELREAHPDDRAFIDALSDEAEALVNANPAASGQIAEVLLAKSREIGYEFGEAVGVLRVAVSHFIQQENKKAFPLALEAYSRLETLNESGLLGQCCTALCGLYYTAGNHQKALEFGHEALNLLRADESDSASIWEGWASYMLGDVYKAAGDLERARGYYERTYKIFVEHEDVEGQARGLIGIGTVCRALRDYEATERHLTTALELMQSIDDGVGIARTLSELGLLRQETGRPDEALDLFDRSLRIRRERTSPLIVATCLIDMGKLLTQLDRTDDAIERLSEALMICEELGHMPRRFATHQALSEAHSKRGEFQKALGHFQEFQRIKEEVTNADVMTRLQNLEISLEAAAAQKEAEMIRAHNRELQEKNAELARLLDELRETQEMLIQSEKMASLGQLTAGIAHEIKNPLNFVNNFSALTKDLAEELSEEIVGHRTEPVAAVEQDFLELTHEIIANAERVLEHGRRAGQIVNSMLVHSRQSGGKKTEVDVNELVADSVDLAYHGFVANNDDFQAAVEQHFDDHAGSFMVIEDEVARVVMNILNNAFCAMKEHVARKSDGYEPRVRVATARQNGMVEISVADNGPGIPNDHKKKVFEPFFTTKPSGSGTGLGLSQSYEIVTTRHGGTLRVEDAEGGGARFVLSIPTLG